MMAETYDIQQLVTASGVPRRTIYFYVQQGLLPPPNGAGLAAHYTEDHLLRLRMIPTLRDQGMRLDEIRTRFTGMSADEMRSVLANKRLTPVITQPEQVINYPPALSEQSYVHYQLSSGISLVVPSNLDLSTRQKVTLLLQSARQILNGRSLPIAHLDVRQPGSSDETPDDKTPFSTQEE